MQFIFLSSNEFPTAKRTLFEIETEKVSTGIQVSIRILNLGRSEKRSHYLVVEYLGIKFINLESFMFFVSNLFFVEESFCLIMDFQKLLRRYYLDAPVFL